MRAEHTVAPATGIDAAPAPAAGSVTSLAPAAAGGGLTPAGIQPRALLRRRRILFAGLNLATMGALAWAMARLFGEGGWSASDIVIMGGFLVGAPWTVMGVWNALIGLWLAHGPGGVLAAAPHLAAAGADRPLAGRTALAMTIRNEEPRRPLERLAVMRAELDATRFGHLFEIFVLSDTSDPAIAAEEERLFTAMRPLLGGARAHYRRRTVNTGFKAGNIRDFLIRDGRRFDFYLPLDADSLMSAAAIIALQRTMEAHPRLGILQGLVVGAPAGSAFTRIFQFGMRHGLRPYVLGAAWWQGDCGPYWGHNALIRTAPFRRHCRLPVLPGRPPLGGHILSHDQVEAALMRRAGWECRVVPLESESWEENPPTLVDYIRRDLRWCQGNMQYWKLLGLRGLPPTSRFQIATAIMMYLGAPAWMALTLAAVAKLSEGSAAEVDFAFGVAMFFVVLALSLVPKLVGLLDIALTPGGAARYGGAWRFAASGLIELLFSMLTAPVIAFRVTLFLAGLSLGRAVGWRVQRRDAHGLAWSEAARAFWPQTLFGLGLLAAVLAAASPLAGAWAAPMIAGLTLSIPLAVLSAAPAAGRWLSRHRLCATPDEIAPPATLIALAARRAAAVPEAAAA